MQKNKQISNSSNNNVVAVMASKYQGPLPTPEDFAGYENILPGAADRILKMAEQQSIHRQKLEQSAIKHNITSSYLGIVFAFLLGLAYLLVGAYCTTKGFDWLGVALGLGGLASLVGVFVYGSSQKRKERESKM